MKISIIDRIKKIQNYSLKELELTLSNYQQDLKTTETLLCKTKAILKKEQNFIASKRHNYPHFLLFYKSMTQKIQDLENKTLQTQNHIQDIHNKMIDVIAQQKAMDGVVQKMSGR